MRPNHDENYFDWRSKSDVFDYDVHDDSPGVGVGVGVGVVSIELVDVTVLNVVAIRVGGPLVVLVVLVVVVVVVLSATRSARRVRVAFGPIGGSERRAVRLRAPQAQCVRPLPLAVVEQHVRAPLRRWQVGAPVRDRRRPN